MKTLHRYVYPYCALCPRKCRVNRKKHTGVCKTGDEIEISACNLHFGEEPPITGTNGSGTIFFAGCNMRCIYCQNYPISQLKSAFRSLTTHELSLEMLKLQKRGAHNINLVTPSHFVHKICESIEIARNSGLTIPVVYNTSSYDRADVIYAIKDYIDVYLADLKYAEETLSGELSGVADYFRVATEAIKAMYNTKGPLQTKNSIASKGLIIRHLVLPGCVNNSKKVLMWIKENLPDVPVSIMFQYFPAYRALNHPLINRKLHHEEYQEIVELVEKLKLKGFLQEYP